MPNEHFDMSVVVSDPSGRARIVSDTLHAAEILLRRWPVDRHSAAHKLAMQACLDAMEGRTDGAAARQAFSRAARAARILLRLGQARQKKFGLRSVAEPITTVKAR
jgi:hypothetical protein